MKEVMQTAWNIARQGQKKHGGKVSEYLSESLKIAWKIAKKLKGVKEVSNEVKLIGSEKQIAWANDIRARVIPMMEAVIDEIRESATATPSRAHFFQKYLDHFETLKSNDSAKFWIETFGYEKMHMGIVNRFDSYVEKMGDVKTPQLVRGTFRAAEKLDAQMIK